MLKMGLVGVLNAYELMKSMVDADAAGVHFENQLASVKRCVYVAGKVLVPNQKVVQMTNTIQGENSSVTTLTDRRRSVLENDSESLLGW